MHIVFLLLELVLIGAPYAFPGLPSVIGQTMFWIGILGLVLYPLWYLRERIGLRMEPWHIIAIGVVGMIASSAVTTGGVIWLYKSAPLSHQDLPGLDAVNGQEQDTETGSQGTETTRYYSSAEKECLGNSLYELGVLTSKEGWSVREEADRIGLGWEQQMTRPQNEVDAYMDLMSGVQKKSERLAISIYVDLNEKYPGCEGDLRAVIGPAVNDLNNPISGLSIAFRDHIEAVKLYRASSSTLNEREKESFRGLIRRSDMSFHEAIGKMDQWLRDVKTRIEDKLRSIG